MVTLQEAYIKVFTDIYPGCYSEKAFEDDGGYVFFPKPLTVPRGEIVFSGTVFPYVDKFSGAVGEFDITKRKLFSPKVINIELRAENSK